jgi:hypothetical protein
VFATTQKQYVGKDFIFSQTTQKCLLLLLLLLCVFGLYLDFSRLKRWIFLNHFGKLFFFFFFLMDAIRCVNVNFEKTLFSWGDMFDKPKVAKQNRSLPL